MNIVYFSPQFPPQYYQFCNQLKMAGATVLGIADTPYDQLAPEVRNSLTEYYRLEDMHDYDGLLRACGYFTHKYGKIDRFESLNEYWLNVEARIRDDFNIFGIRSMEIDHVRRKSFMKQTFKRAGVEVARGCVVTNITEARDLIAETGYPVVVKPDAGVGALNTFRLNTDDDLKAFFATKPSDQVPGHLIMEEFIFGTIYSFDGLTDRDGNLVFYTSHKFSQGIMETVNEARHLYYYSLRQIPETLEVLGRQCVREFNIRERFFHIEFFKTAENTFVGLEVNMRPPGGFTTDMFNYACDIDIYRTWAQLLVHGNAHLDYTRGYHCCYASRKNHYNYINTHDDIMARWGAVIMHTASVPGVFSSALGDIGYIFRSPDIDQIETITAYIQATQPA